MNDAPITLVRGVIATKAIVEQILANYSLMEGLLAQLAAGVRPRPQQIHEARRGIRTATEDAKNYLKNMEAIVDG